MLRIMAIGIFCLLLSPGIVSSDSRVSLSDLESLSRKGLHAEALEKLEQIPGAQRDGRWSKLLLEVTKTHLSQEKKLATDKSLRKIVSLFQRYPQLQQSNEHSRLVGEGLTDWFNHCHNSHALKACVSNLGVILDTIHPFSDTKELKYLIHTIARNDAVLAFPLYNILVTKFEEAGLCEEGLFRTSILATLESEGAEKDIRQATEYLSGSCSTGILRNLPSELSNSGRRFQERVCPVLIEANLLSNLQKKRCERVLEEKAS